MTKGELIKLLQDAPFGDDAEVSIGHRYVDLNIIVEAEAQLDIIGVGVNDQNELTINFEPTIYTSVLIQFGKI